MSADIISLSPFYAKRSLRDVFTVKSRRNPKLVWAPFGKVMWPAILYPSLKEFDTDVHTKLKTNPSAYNAFQIHLKALTHLNKGSNYEVLLFLGRSLHDFQFVRGRNKQKHYKCFSDSETSKTIRDKVVCNPEAFGMDKKEYFAFHLGLDEARKRSGEREGSRVSYSKQAFNAWDGF
eukprot:scaffold2308_cov103-Cylindrotheca_fusiformis.AAC.8